MMLSYETGELRINGSDENDGVHVTWSYPAHMVVIDDWIHGIAPHVKDAEELLKYLEVEVKKQALNRVHQ